LHDSDQYTCLKCSANCRGQRQGNGRSFSSTARADGALTAASGIYSEALKQQSKPPHAKTVYAPASMVWLAEQNKAG